jgi:hypothetical protein
MPHKSDPTDENVRLLLLAMADTTWRMFTPPILFVPMGLWADLTYGTKPWFTLLAAGIGIALGALLVKRQLRGNG